MRIIINTASGDPIYQQITDQIKQQVWDGTLHPGDSLPSIRQLAKDLRVSVITTKRAYEDLEREGFIVSQVGRGTYIADRNPEDLAESKLTHMLRRIDELVKEARTLRIPPEQLAEMVAQRYRKDEN